MLHIDSLMFCRGTSRPEDADNDNLLFDLGDFYSLNLNDFVWRKIALRGDVPRDRCGHHFVTIDNKIVLLGGGAGEAWYERFNVSELFVFDTETEIWSRIECRGDDPGVFAFPVIAQYENFVFLFGGQSVQDTVPVDGLFVLDLLEMKWLRIETENSPTGRDMTSGAFVQGKMFMFGGFAHSALRDTCVLRLDPRLEAIMQ
jgi:hypothetical protein